MTFFQQPLEKNDAIKQCQEMGGNLVNSGFKEQLERSYLDYWKSNSGESFKENKDLIFKNNEYAEINWSNPETPQVDIKSINKKNIGSFICSTNIKDDLSHVDLTELKKCSNSKIQHFYKCAGIKGGKCQCWTAFLQPLNRQDASKACNKVEGSLVQETSIELERFLEHLETEKSIDIETDNKFIINDTNYIDVKWSAESRKRANIETSKKIEEGSFICVSNISDNTLNPIDFENLKLCKDNRIQKSYECVGNPKENCKCMTFFQQPLEKNDAIKQCQEMGGNLVNSGFKEQLERSYLDYWKSNSGESFKENKDLIFKNNEYAEINWSNPETPQVDIKSINKKNIGSFICSTNIKDDLSHVDLTELKKCSNSKIQHFYKCAGIKGGKCQCWTAFLQPLNRQDASKACNKVEGSLVQETSIELERFLEHLETEKSIDIETDNKFIINDTNYIDVKWSAESRKRANIETSKKIEEGSFICVSNISDNTLNPIDFENLKLCKDNRIQKSYECVGNPKENCKCMTFFQQPLEENDAIKQCQEMGGNLVNSGFKEQLERSYLDYWKSNSGESFKENKDLIFKNDEYAEIKWSNPETPQVDIKSINKKTIGSFICSTKIKDDLSHVDLTELKKCSNSKIQHFYKCAGIKGGKCQCWTAFLQPLNRQDASKACNKVEGSLVQETSIELERFLEHLETEKSIDIETDNKFIINDTNYIDVKWSAESRKRANIETSKKIEERSFICVSNISDNTLNPIDFENLKLCKDNRIQKSYECVGNPKENCKCMTFFQQPLEENDAIKQCQEMGGNLVNSGFKEQLERSYLDYWKSNSGESFKENKDLIFKNDEYAEIKWSNPETPQVDIKSINKKTIGSFICSTKIKDDLSHVDLTELKKCSNSKIQHFYKCAGIKGGKCQCWTAFLQPLNRQDASKACNKVEGSLVQETSIELERFLEHLETEKSIDIETDNKFIINDTNYIDVKWSAESRKRANIETSKKIEERSFICVSNISDNTLNPIDFENLKLCKDNRIQKSYECVGNPKENCKCMTFFQQPLEENDAIKQCQEMGGNLVNSGFKEQLERSYLDYWKSNSGESFKENKDLIFKNDEYAEIKWSNPETPQRPVEKNEAIQHCQEMGGNLVDSSLKKKLEGSYLNYWKNKSGETFKENTDLIFKNDEYAEIKWSNPETPQVDIKSINKKNIGSFICSTKIEDDLSHVDLTELKKCSNSKIQHFYKCAGIKGGKCQCWTAFLKPLNRQDASKACNKVEGSLVQETSIELERFLEHLETEKSIDIETDNKFIINDTNYIDVKWSAESRKRANIETSKKIEEGSFICVSNISDNTLNPIDFENLKLCKDKRIQKSYECIANPRENCKCMTFFQQPLEKNEAIEQCKNMGGNLVDSSFKDELEESFLNYWKSNSGETFKENTDLIFGDDQYAEIDWSNNKQPQVIVKIMNKTQSSFICVTEIKDGLSNVDYENLKNCEITKIQKLYNCGSISKGICQCLTVFLGPLDSVSASKECSRAGGTLLESNSDEIELFLHHLILNNYDTIKTNPQFIVGNDSIAYINWQKDLGAKTTIKNSLETRDKLMPFFCKILPDKSKKERINQDVSRIVHIAIDTLSDENRKHRLKLFLDDFDKNQRERLEGLQKKKFNGKQKYRPNVFLHALEDYQRLEGHHYFPRYLRIKREFYNQSVQEYFNKLNKEKKISNQLEEIQGIQQDTQDKITKEEIRSYMVGMTEYKFKMSKRNQMAYMFVTIQFVLLIFSMIFWGLFLFVCYENVN
ncbi:hypothetical protein QYM36_002876 [Artemia franciscana]|uniref:Uncharacterized protein n=1 Tax=Artemia franciscana TaxID=6661 RepID=A0AA88I711_ARTSF|nr:hypothetical protein QYM36_002876 [Artemia franciscana]